MSTKVQNINEKISSAYVVSLSKEEHIDNLLDEINNRKKKYREIASCIGEISRLFTRFTWINNLTDNDKAIIKNAITKGKKRNQRLEQFYINQYKIYHAQGLFTEELKILEDSIAVLDENISEVDYIIFELREDKEFRGLCDFANAL